LSVTAVTGTRVTRHSRHKPSPQTRNERPPDPVTHPGPRGVDDHQRDTPCASCRVFHGPPGTVVPSGRRALHPHVREPDTDRSSDRNLLHLHQLVRGISHHLPTGSHAVRRAFHPHRIQIQRRRPSTCPACSTAETPGLGPGRRFYSHAWSARPAHRLSRRCRTPTSDYATASSVT